MTMIAEGAEAKRAEDALAERKRKMEEKERWEGQPRRLSPFLEEVTDFSRPYYRNARGPRFGLAEFQQEEEETDQRTRSSRLTAGCYLCL